MTTRLGFTANGRACLFTLGALVLMSGCGKQAETPATAPPSAPPPVAASKPEPAPAPRPVPVKPKDFVISGVHVGKGFGEYNHVAQETGEFGPNDQVDVAVYSDGFLHAKGNIRVAWVGADGKPVEEKSIDVDYNGSRSDPFSLKKSGGLAPGSYRVEVYANDWKAASAPFTVR